MIDFEKAEKAFNNFLDSYDKNDEKVKGKIVHTFNTVKVSEKLAKDLNLNEEDTNLSKLIALLHDIGRFEQAKYDAKCFDQVELNMDHGDYGAKLLFEENLIRNFINDDKYDNIIYKAIINHNKSEIEPGLNENALSIADKWILNRLNSTIISINENMEKYEFGVASTYMYNL